MNTHDAEWVATNYRNSRATKKRVQIMTKYSFSMRFNPHLNLKVLYIKGVFCNLLNKKIYNVYIPTHFPMLALDCIDM